MFPWISVNRRDGPQSAPPHGDGVAPELRETAALDCAGALHRLSSTVHGLSAAEVERRRQQYGENKLAHEKKAG
jgi:alpha-L-fucosidase